MMSNFSTRLALPAPKNAAAAPGWEFLAQDCLLCAAASGYQSICAACAAALPTIATACSQCAIALPQQGVCGECLSHPFAFDAARACFEYRFPLDRLVRRFKYGGDLALGRWLALRLADRVVGLQPDCVVAPPLTRSRLRQRGFNPALEIAKVVARRVGARCDLFGLVKVRETSPQPGLARRERRANLRNAFRCDLDVQGMHVAVVDDVMTTGATMDALAEALKQRGAARVSAWCIARTPHPAR